MFMQAQNPCSWAAKRLDAKDAKNAKDASLAQLANAVSAPPGPYSAPDNLLQRCCDLSPLYPPYINSLSSILSSATRCQLPERRGVDDACNWVSATAGDTSACRRVSGK